ncbi:MAG: HigA family addiction module antitoxin [Rhodospirillaceae bacterium]|nr:HigA family addiction module antitoxin [Rhodospirillaceae bacterium]
MPKRLEPIPPGEILVEEFLKPLGVSQNQLARALGVAPSRINDIVHGRRGMSAETALGLALFFGTTPEFWLNLQTRYDLKAAERAHGKSLRRRIAAERRAA